MTGCTGSFLTLDPPFSFFLEYRYFSYTLFFRATLGSRQNWENVRRVRHPCLASPLPISSPRILFVINNEPRLHQASLFVMYIRWVWINMWWRGPTNTASRYCPWPQIPLSSTYYPPPVKPLATAALFTTSVLWPFPECHIDAIIQYVAFSDYFFSLRINNRHLRFLYVFYVVNTILSGCTTIYLPTHLLRDISVACRFWQFWMKLQ